MSLLVCEGLVKDYPGKRAVDGVDFHVDEGEIVGLLGPNGAGKSTTFRMACGLAAHAVADRIWSGGKTSAAVGFTLRRGAASSGNCPFSGQ